ncbi:MAG TPA: TIGR02266 family protein [Myxococcaceae bacterium]|nr:TIGR02266 family protein [Myxococcaceae bacterium]
MQADKRQHERVSSRLRCWCEGQEVTFYARVHNLSEGGLFLKTLTPLEEGTRARLKLEDGGHRVDAEAVVIWTQGEGANDTPAGMGLAFVGLPDPAREQLRRLVGREQRRDGVTPEATAGTGSV